MIITSDKRYSRNYALDQVLIDTSGWVALFVRGEAQHDTAIALFQQLWGQGRQFLPTNYILSELVSLFVSPLRVPRQAQ